jgi:hypothetical protein
MVGINEHEIQGAVPPRSGFEARGDEKMHSPSFNTVYLSPRRPQTRVEEGVAREVERVD